MKKLVNQGSNKHPCMTALDARPLNLIVEPAVDNKSYWADTRKDILSITVNVNWRMTFEFSDGNVYILNYEDYH